MHKKIVIELYNKIAIEIVMPSSKHIHSITYTERPCIQQPTLLHKIALHVSRQNECIANISPFTFIISYISSKKVSPYSLSHALSSLIILSRENRLAPTCSDDICHSYSESLEATLKTFSVKPSYHHCPINIDIVSSLPRNS